MTDDHLVIVMEYASGGPLEERIATSGPCSEDEAKKMYRQLVDGMAYCHAQVSLASSSEGQIGCWHAVRDLPAQQTRSRLAKGLSNGAKCMGSFICIGYMGQADSS